VRERERERERERDAENRQRGGEDVSGLTDTVGVGERDPRPKAISR